MPVTCSIEFLRHDVLLVFGAPCQRSVRAGQEHGRDHPINGKPHAGYTTTDMAPALRFRGAGLTITFTSWPSTVKNSISRPTETDTGLQRMSAEICAWVVPRSFAASCW
jgi:hypothetical protein